MGHLAEHHDGVVRRPLSRQQQAAFRKGADIAGTLGQLALLRDGYGQEQRQEAGTVVSPDAYIGDEVECVVCRPCDGLGGNTRLLPWSQAAQTRLSLASISMSCIPRYGVAHGRRGQRGRSRRLCPAGAVGEFPDAGQSQVWPPSRKSRQYAVDSVTLNAAGDEPRCQVRPVAGLVTSSSQIR